MSTAWILVSDAARGRLFEASGTPCTWTELAGYSNSDLRGLPARGGSGRTVPRTHDSIGPARHVIEPHASRRDKSTRAFARMLVADLLEANARHRYERLFLVAPPRFLGVLRGQLGDPAAAGVAGELGSDLAALPTEALIGHLREAFQRAFPAKAARSNR